VVARRGDIWWASLPAPRRSEPGYRRPVVIVQAQDFNDSRIGTLVIVTVTSNVALADAPGNVLLPRHATRLRKEAVANVSQIMTIDRSFLIERVGTLSVELLARVDAGLRLVLSL
jgi:mRNA interferase MazF